MEEVKIEVTGVPAKYDEEILKLLFENEKKMGREIQIGDVLFNRNRKAALVTLSPRGKAIFNFQNIFLSFSLLDKGKSSETTETSALHRNA